MTGLMETLGSWVMDLLFGFVTLPMFPPQVAEVMAYILTWVAAGMGILDFFCPIDAIFPALIFFLVLSTSEGLYHMIMWVLNKIPIIDID